MVSNVQNPEGKKKARQLGVSKQNTQQSNVVVAAGFVISFGSSLPYVERAPEVTFKAEGWHRAGRVVVEAATVTVLVDVAVEVGMAAVTVDLITYPRGEGLASIFLDSRRVH